MPCLEFRSPEEMVHTVVLCIYITLSGLRHQSNRGLPRLPRRDGPSGPPLPTSLLGSSSRRGEEEPMEIIAIMILAMGCIPKISINIKLDA